MPDHVEAGSLVVGLGAPDRGDDAVGPAVARGVAALGLPGVRVVEHHDPTDVIDLWSEYDVAVVVDGIRSGSPPGTVTVRDDSSLSQATWRTTGGSGTHAFGLADAVDLARALGRLPSRLVLVGVEIGSVGHGRPLSPPVAAAVDSAVEAVVTQLGRHHAGTGSEASDVPR